MTTTRHAMTTSELTLWDQATDFIWDAITQLDAAGWTREAADLERDTMQIVTLADAIMTREDARYQLECLAANS
jgi:hypothetical protein